MSWQCHCKGNREPGWNWSGNNSSEWYFVWCVLFEYDYISFRKYHHSYPWWQMDGQPCITTNTHLSPSSTLTSHPIHQNYGSLRATSLTSSTLPGVTQESEWVKNWSKSSQNSGCGKRWVCRWSYSQLRLMYVARLDNWWQRYCQQCHCLLCLQHPWP